VFGSRAVEQGRIARYTIGNISVLLDAVNNSMETVEVSGVAP